MVSLKRVAWSVALTVTMGTGCVQVPQQAAYRAPLPICDPRMSTARMEESHGHLTQAKNLYVEIYHQNPQNIDCAHRLGVICTMLNQHREADHYFRQAYAVTPNDAELLADMGFSAFQRRDYEQADAFLEQSVRLNGNDQRTITNLAIARAWRGKDDSSLATFRKVLPEAEAARRLSEIQVARGDKVRIPAQSDNAVAMAPRTQGLSTGVGQAQLIANDSGPVDLPSPAPAPGEPIDLPSVEPRPLPLSLNETAEISIASVTTEVRIESPAAAPLPQLATAPATLSIMMIESENDGRLNPDELLIQVAKMEATSSSSVDILPSPAGATTAVALTVEPAIELAVEAVPIIEAVILPSPSPTPIPDDVPTPVLAVATPRPSVPSNALTVWRKTPADRSNPTECPARQLSDLEEPLIREEVESIETKKNTWGVCLVTLIEEKRLEFGSAEFMVEYESQQYRFSSFEAMTKFQQSPHQYLPAAGGFDVVTHQNLHKRVSGSLNFAYWYGGKLYLFSTRENAQAFSKDPQKYIR